ncbi:hypothetical protein FQN50_004957 [Emmonsiellopsis sp. PD_5]|nr:hypothetical protein FQN50_004957 [Emmonsiellopsis sp. PD_5]
MSKGLGDGRGPWDQFRGGMTGWSGGVENSRLNRGANTDVGVNQEWVEIAFTFMEFKKSAEGFKRAQELGKPVEAWPKHADADRFQQEWKSYATLYTGVPFKDGFTIRTSVPTANNAFEPSGNHVRYLALQILTLKPNVQPDNYQVQDKLREWEVKVALNGHRILPSQEATRLCDSEGQGTMYVLLGPWNMDKGDVSWEFGRVVDELWINQNIDTDKSLLTAWEVERLDLGT